MTSLINEVLILSEIDFSSLARYCVFVLSSKVMYPSRWKLILLTIRNGDGGRISALDDATSFSFICTSFVEDLLISSTPELAPVVVALAIPCNNDWEVNISIFCGILWL